VFSFLFREPFSGSKVVLFFHGCTKFGITEEEVAQYFSKEDNLYSKISGLRNEFYEKEGKKLIDREKEATGINQTSVDFIKLLANYDEQNKQTALQLFKTINPSLKVDKDYHVIFVLDASGSMATQLNPQSPENRWLALLGAVKTFINKRRLANARDIITIIEYDNAVHLQCESQMLSTNFDQLLHLFGGGTNFSVGLAAAQKVLQKNKHDIYTPVLLFLSDGECNNGEIEMSQISAAHKQHGLVVRTLGFCDGGAAKLQQLATLGGGQFINSIDGIQLEDTFKQIAVALEAGTTN